jgi:eukaryotic-like serine/threonine-protein kinase
VISETALNRLHGLLGPPDLSGTRYELVSVLGRGGMAVVYLARDKTLEREVALKVLDWNADDASAARLAQEARILANLEHPGIVPVHDFGQLADGRRFYAMKRVRGERLDRWAEVRELHARLTAFLRICDAVAFAHAHGVVHRDLKPANVMVGEFGEVLVLDWGIARIRGQSDTGGVVAGTPDYMSPEQARGVGVDARADIYALGCVLYRALSGEVVYDAESDVDKMWAHIHSPPPALLEVRPELPGALGEVVSRALAKAPEDRQQSAGELARELRAAVSSARP